MILWQDDTRIKWKDIKGIYLTEYDDTLEEACREGVILAREDVVSFFSIIGLQNVYYRDGYSITANYSSEYSCGYFTWNPPHSYNHYFHTYKNDNVFKVEIEQDIISLSLNTLPNYFSQYNRIGVESLSLSDYNSGEQICTETDVLKIWYVDQAGKFIDINTLTYTPTTGYIVVTLDSNQYLGSHVYLNECKLRVSYATGAESILDFNNNNKYIRFRPQEGNKTHEYVSGTQGLDNNMEGLLYLGDLVFGVASTKTYIWTHNKQSQYELESGFWPLYEKNISQEMQTIQTTDKNQQLAWFNTQYFKINEKNIIVLTDNKEHFNINDGNFTYNQPIQYPVSSKTTNAYAWNKTQDISIPLYTNTNELETDSRINPAFLELNNQILTINNTSFLVPENSKIVIIARESGEVEDIQGKVPLYNASMSEPSFTSGQWQVGVNVYANNDNILRDYGQAIIHLDNVNSNTDKTPSIPNTDQLCKCTLSFKNKYKYFELDASSKFNRIFLKQLPFAYFNVLQSKYKTLFTDSNFETQLYVELPNDYKAIGDPDKVVHGEIACVTGKKNRRDTTKIQNEGGTTYHYQYGESGYLTIQTEELYDCNLFDNELYELTKKEASQVESVDGFSYSSYEMSVSNNQTGLLPQSYKICWIENTTARYSITEQGVKYYYNVSDHHEDCNAYALIESDFQSDKNPIRYWIFLVKQ